jgi:hypothetical protein
MMASWLRALTLGAAALLAIGFIWLLAYMLAEAFLGDGQGSLVDAYWRGRLPWMGIAEALIVVGATACAVAGAASVMVEGGWVRRIVVVPPLIVVGLWWLLATAMSTMRAVPCNDCPAPAPDPWAYAYSAPQTALLFLIAPSAVIALLALVRERSAKPYISPS